MNSPMHSWSDGPVLHWLQVTGPTSVSAGVSRSHLGNCLNCLNMSILVQVSDTILTLTLVSLLRWGRQRAIKAQLMTILAYTALALTNGRSLQRCF